MNKNLKQFLDRLSGDREMQSRAQALLRSCPGEKTEEKIFSAVLLPLAEEAGLCFSLADLKAYKAEMEKSDLAVSRDELQQTVGGGGGGLGYNSCDGFGGGFGVTITSDGFGFCIFAGYGRGDKLLCIAYGDHNVETDSSYIH